MNPVALLNLVSTIFMTGLIWFVQVVHYPLHGAVPEESFVDYQQRHMLRTTFVVALPMLTEFATAAYLAYRPPFGPTWVWMAGVVLVLVTTLSTYFLQRPAHVQLQSGLDAETHHFLVQSNWIRTLAWSLRSILWGYLLVVSY